MQENPNLENQHLVFDPLNLQIPIYEGPFEALLELIRKKKLSIYSVRLSEICVPYLDYIKQAKTVNLELGSEFISLAATLILIKSKSLVPKHSEEKEILEEEEINHEEQIRKKLIELDLFEKLSLQLSQRKCLYRDIFPRPNTLIEEESPTVQLSKKNLTLFELIKAYQKTKQNKPHLNDFVIETDEISLQGLILELIDFLSINQEFEWGEYFDSFQKQKYILLFLAILELTHQNLIRIFQNESLMSIQCFRSEKFEEYYEAYLSHYQNESFTLF